MPVVTPGGSLQHAVAIGGDGSVEHVVELVDTVIVLVGGAPVRCHCAIVRGEGRPHGRPANTAAGDEPLDHPGGALVPADRVAVVGDRAAVTVDALAGSAWPLPTSCCDLQCLSVMTAPVSAGTLTSEISSSSQRVMRSPLRGRFGSSGSVSVGSNPIETAETTPDFTSPQTSSANGLVPKGGNSALPFSSPSTTDIPVHRATGFSGRC